MSDDNTTDERKSVLQTLVDRWRQIAMSDPRPSPGYMATAFYASMAYIRLGMVLDLSEIRSSEEKISEWQTILNENGGLLKQAGIDLNGDMFIYLDGSDTTFLVEAIKDILTDKNLPILIIKLLGHCKYYLEYADCSKLKLPMLLSPYGDGRYQCEVIWIYEPEHDEVLTALWQIYHEMVRTPAIQSYYTQTVAHMLGLELEPRLEPVPAGT